MAGVAASPGITGLSDCFDGFEVAGFDTIANGFFLDHIAVTDDFIILWYRFICPLFL